MFLADSTMATFDFMTEELVTGVKTPKLVLEATKSVRFQLSAQAGSLANKLSKGAKLHQLITATEALNFEIYQTVMKPAIMGQKAPSPVFLY